MKNYEKFFSLTGSPNELVENLLLAVELLSSEWGRRGWAGPLLAQQKLRLRPVVLDDSGRGSLDHAQSGYRVQDVGVAGDTGHGSCKLIGEEGQLEEGRGGQPCH